MQDLEERLNCKNTFKCFAQLYQLVCEEVGWVNGKVPVKFLFFIKLCVTFQWSLGTKWIFDFNLLRFVFYDDLDRFIERFHEASRV